MRIKVYPNIFDKKEFQEFDAPYLYQEVGDYFDEFVPGGDSEEWYPIISGRVAFWHEIPCSGDDVHFVKYPHGPLAALVAALGSWVASISITSIITNFLVSLVAGAVLSFASKLLFGKAGNPAAVADITQGATQSQNYSWDGIQNPIGEGNSVPVVWGRHRVGGIPIEVYADGNRADGQFGGRYLNALYAVSEGEIEEVETDTALLNNQDIKQFPDLQQWENTGAVDQDPIDNFSKVIRQYNIIGCELKYQNPYYYRTNAEVDGAQIVISYLAGLASIANDGSVGLAGGNFIFSYAPAGTQDWSTPERVHWEGSTLSKIEFGKFITFPQRGKYDIKITRDTVDIDTAKIIAKSYFTAVLEYENALLAYPNTALYGFRLKATDKISGSMPTATVIISGRKVKDVRTGVVAFSKNPANILYDVLTHVRFGLGKWFNDSRIDLDSLKDFADWCDEEVTYREWDSSVGAYVDKTEKRYEFNFILDQRYKGIDFISKLCGTCRAIPFFVGDKLKIVIDRPATPVQLFTMSNIVAKSFEETYCGLPDIPNQVDAQILDENNDFKQRPITGIDKTRLSEPIQAKTIDLYGLTTLSRAKREVTYALKKLKGTRKWITFETGIGGVVCEPGDPFWFQHDVPQYGFGGHIASVQNSNNLILNITVDVTAGKQYTILVKHKDNTFYTYTWTAPTDAQGVNIVTVPSGHNIQAGDIFSFGEVGKEAKPFRSLSITKKSEKTVEINAEEYNESIYDEDGSIDVRFTNYSQLGLVHNYNVDPDTGDVTPGDPRTNPGNPQNQIPPMVTEVHLAEQLELVGNVRQSNILVSFGAVQTPANSLAHVVKYGILYSIDGGKTWILSGYTTGGTYPIRAVQQGKKYYVCVMSVTNYGIESPVTSSSHALDFSITPGGKSSAPDAPTGLAATPGVLLNVLTWKNPSDKDIDRIEIWCAEGANDRTKAICLGTTKAETWTHSGLTAGTDYFYWVVAFDTAGNQSAWEPVAADGGVQGTASTDGTVTPVQPKFKVTYTVANNQITLAWTALTDPSITGFLIFIGEDEAALEACYQIASIPAQTFAYTTPYTAWFTRYYVVPTTAQGNSSLATFVDIDKVPMPQGIKLVISEPNINVSWTAVEGAIGYWVWIDSGFTRIDYTTATIYAFSIPAYDTTVKVQAVYKDGRTSAPASEFISVDGVYQWNIVKKVSFQFSSGNFVNLVWMNDSEIERPSIRGGAVQAPYCQNANDSDLWNFIEAYQDLDVADLDVPVEWFREKWWDTGNAWYESQVFDLGKSYTGRLQGTLTKEIVEYTGDMALIPDIDMSNYDYFDVRDLMSTDVHIDASFQVSIDGQTWKPASIGDNVTARYVKFVSSIIAASPLVDIRVTAGEILIDVPDITETGIVTFTGINKDMTLAKKYNELTVVFASAMGDPKADVTGLNVNENGVATFAITLDKFYASTVTVYWFAKGY